MGANVPSWLVKLLKIGLKAIDDAGEKMEGEAERVDEIQHSDHTEE